MKSYVFPVVLEPAGNAWRAYAPELEGRGAATWGRSQEEVLHNLQEVLQMVVEGLLENGERLPARISASSRPRVAVNVG